MPEHVPGRRQEPAGALGQCGGHRVGHLNRFTSIFTANLRSGNSDDVLGDGNLFALCKGY